MLIFCLALWPLGACDCGQSVAETSEPDDLPQAQTESDLDPTSPRVVRYDLLAHRSRARLRHGDTLVLDLGGDAGAQYTFGGWRTRTGRSQRQGEVDSLLIEGVTGEILLPSETSGAATLQVRMRAVGDGQATLYVNGETVRYARLPRNGSFDIVTAHLDAGTLHVGENMFQVRVAELGRIEGVRASVAIDWIRLAPAPAEEQPVQPEDTQEIIISTPITPVSIRQRGQPLVLPEGYSLTWPIDPSDWTEPTLVGELSSGTMRVSWRPDLETPPRLLSELAAGPFSVAVPDVFGELSFEATSNAALTRAQMVSSESSTVVSPTGAPPPTNVVVFLVDTVRADKLHPFNPESRVQTPGLDGWARRSAVFLAGHTQENWTKPSVATLLTGLYPWQHTATSDEAVLPESAAMLSELLSDEGFQTAAFICNGYVSDAFGFEQGWGSWRNYIREGRRTQARFVAADVLEWLDGRDESKPFFLYIHTIDPHVPYIPPNEMLALYDPDPYSGPIDFTEDRELLEKIKSGRLRPNARDRRRLEALYDGEITYHDVHFASILEGLERRGLGDTTMVVFTADHGEEFFDHDSVGHGHSLYEELLHVPLLVRLPGRTDASPQIDEPVGLIDVAPTILEALGHEIPTQMPGRSLLPLLEGQVSDVPRPVVSGFMQGWRSVVVGRYKLIQRTHRVSMVFDLREDPDELNDISEDNPLLVRYLRGLLGLTLAGRTHSEHQAETTVIDAETEAQLRQLGYVGSQRPQ